MVDISIVIPVYNSEGCLLELNRQIGHALGDISYEIFFVNDQSRDDSWGKIVDIAKNNKNVIGINLRKNSGQDNAIMAGLRQTKGNYVVIMDDDLQHSPYDIKKLYNQCKTGNHDVCFANFLKRKTTSWKEIGSRINGKVAELLISKPMHIYLSPFKIIKGEVVDEIIKHDWVYPYVDGIILSITDNLTQINVGHRKRFHGKSNYNLIRSIKVFMKLATSFSVIPLRMASFVGFITSLVGFLLGCYYIIYHFFSKNNIPGWTTLVVIVLFLGGLVLLSLGIVGEYVGRTYLSLNNRAQYSVKETVKSS